MKYGDIELLNSKIFNLKVEELAVDPTFTVDERTRIYYNTATNSYKFNNGSNYVDLSLPANFLELINTLGSNWVNDDFTFNPTAFNNLHNVSNLTSDSNLFDVVEQLDTAIHNLAAPELDDLQDVTVPQNISTGQMLYFNTNGYTFADLDTLLENYSTIKIGTLKDVASNPTNGGSLVYDADANQYNVIQTSVVIKDFFNTISHSISHDLGVKYVAVTVIDAGTDTTITSAVVQYIDENALNITLPSAAPIIVILTIPFGSD